MRDETPEDDDNDRCVQNRGGYPDRLVGIKQIDLLCVHPLIWPGSLTFIILEPSEMNESSPVWLSLRQEREKIRRPGPRRIRS